jgi:glutathione peroxidase
MSRPILFASLLFTLLMSAQAAPLHDVALRDIAGQPTTLAAYRGRVLLVVNVASECGYTRQYTGLQALFAKYQAKGLTVLGFPCNQFGGQEPGTESEIRQFCSTTFQVTFPLFAKVEVNGAGRHPLYTLLAGPASPFPGNIPWNFTKFLVGRDGRVLARFDPGTEPDAPELVRALESALASQ